MVSEQVSLKARESFTNFYINPFTTRMPILISTLVCSLSTMSTWDRLLTNFYFNPFTTVVLILIGPSYTVKRLGICYTMAVSGLPVIHEWSVLIGHEGVA